MKIGFDQVTLDDPSLEASAWGPTADPDRDGLENLEEAYFGKNPNLPDAQIIAATAVAKGIFAYVWQRAADFQGVKMTPGWSPNCVTWYSSGNGPAGGSQREIMLSNLGPQGPGGGDVLALRIENIGDASGFVRLNFMKPEYDEYREERITMRAIVDAYGPKIGVQKS